MTTAGDVAGRLLDVVEEHLAALAARDLPGFRLPALLLGHPVGADVRADLLFTLGLLHEAGRTKVAGLEIPEVISAVLAPVDGARTHTFYSYRVAETVGRFGAFDGNPVLAPLTEEQREQVALACDSTDWITALDDGKLPRNYAAVLARCELARHRLGLTDRSKADALLERVAALLGEHDEGWLDDTHTGAGRYDIYTVDVYLFTEPFAAELGDVWARGARAALRLVDTVAATNGAAVTWGRSSGALAACHTIELGGLACRHDGLAEDPGRWVARTAAAVEPAAAWFRDGWITAHQHRSTYAYRGLDRRLQMTLDCLGKLADAAAGLQQRADQQATADERDLFPDRDEMVWFDRDRNAGVWSYRSGATAFALPLVGSTVSDYLPAPRNPGLFEVPVGCDLTTGTPQVLHKGVRYAAGGLPVEAGHEPGSLSATYDGFPQAGAFEPGPDTKVLPGGRKVRWTVRGRTLAVDEELTFDPDDVPHGLAVQVTEADGRPLRVSWDADVPLRATSVEVGGIKEYRSFWSELPVVHQADLDPAATVRLRYEITPLHRVVSTAWGHHYGDSLYAPVADRVRHLRFPFSALRDGDRLREVLAGADVFHLHWPEWLATPDLGIHQRAIDAIRGAGVRILWTQHNLVPHVRDERAVPVYEAWAEAADAVIHHTVWGRDRALDRYRYGEHTRHAVIPHGHFGGLSDAFAAAERAEVEAELGLTPGRLRLGIVGAPRVDKHVAMAMEAFAACTRDDVELLVLSLGPGEEAPDDPRIVALPYEMVPRDVYDRRLAALDALLMPFDPEGEMLATGTVGDAIGHGLATVASDWPFLTEVLGDAAVVYGRTAGDLTACVENLGREQLARAAAEAEALRHRHEWSVVAEATVALLDELGTGHL